MKYKISLLFIGLSLNVFASIPTEEGLLRNLNNTPIPGAQVTLKAMVKKVAETGKPESDRMDYYKFVINLDGDMSLLQINYSGSQMLNSQIQDAKLISNLTDTITKDKSPEKGIFYGVMSMLATNKTNAIIAFVEKSGAVVTKNKNLLNEDKLKLLKTYRTYLMSTKGKGEASSPLNPQDAEEKAKVLELFKSNTYQRSQNISLSKEGNEFLWKADWKNVKAYFTNEERRLKSIEYNLGTSDIRLEASEYTLFNNNNEFPKFITIKDANGEAYKVQFLSQEVKKVADKKLNERLDEAKKAIVKQLEPSEIFEFLF